MIVQNINLKRQYLNINMKIGIFGGSFNPPHNMHLNIAKILYKKNLVDKVIFVPTGVNYEYKTNLVPNIDRYNMLKIITKRYSYMDVSSFEFTDKVTHTYETLDYFKSIYPEDEIYFILGADNLDYIDKWANSNYLLKTYSFIAFKRDNYILKDYSKYNAKIIYTDIKESSISSSKIRESIENNNYNIKELNKYVIKYIKKHNLYRKDLHENI